VEVCPLPDAAGSPALTGLLDGSPDKLDRNEQQGDRQGDGWPPALPGRPDVGRSCRPEVAMLQAMLRAWDQAELERSRRAPGHTRGAEHSNRPGQGMAERQRVRRLLNNHLSGRRSPSWPAELHGRAVRWRPTFSVPEIERPGSAPQTSGRSGGPQRLDGSCPTSMPWAWTSRRSRLSAWFG
jgi:hypothetical protein